MEVHDSLVGFGQEAEVASRDKREVGALTIPEIVHLSVEPPVGAGLLAVGIGHPADEHDLIVAVPIEVAGLDGEVATVLTQGGLIGDSTPLVQDEGAVGVQGHEFDLVVVVDEGQNDFVPSVAIEVTPDAQTLGAFTWPQPVAIVLGNEVNGINERVLRRCQSTVCIPMYGYKNTINVATAVQPDRHTGRRERGQRGFGAVRHPGTSTFLSAGSTRGDCLHQR